MNELAAAGFGLAAIVHVAFAAYLWRTHRAQDSAGRPSHLFVGAVLATGLWAGLELASELLRDLFWPIAAALTDLARYGAWLALLAGLAGPLVASGRRPRLPWVLAGLVGLALALQIARGAAGTIVDPPSRLVLASLLALPVAGLFLVEQLFRNLPEDSRWHAKPMYLGLAIVFAFDVFMVSEALMFGRWDPQTHAARGLVHLLAVPVLFVGARRRVDWIARLQVSRAVAFHSATLMLAGLYLLLLSAIGYYVRYFGGTWGQGLQLSLVFAALAFGVAVAVSGSLRARMRVFLGKHFFRYRFDYREQWLRFTAMLSTRGTPQEVGEQVIQGLANMVECPGGSLWTRASPDAADAPYRQAVRWNMPRIEAEEPADSEFCRLLRDKAWVVNLDEYRSAPRRYEAFAMPTWLLGSTTAWLVVPLLAGDELLGFVVLAAPRTRIDVNWEVLDLLKTASRQAATHLAQMQATEALLEARKFEAFNRMSAFVVHDLKNIITQLSLMVKNAERLHDNREFQQDMLLTVESSLEKMRRLMLQLREGAAPPGGSRGVELPAIVQRLEALARNQGRVLEVQQAERLATRGHEDRLERVLGHLVQNAFDATPQDGQVWLHAARYSGQVKIEIGDTGSGMSEEFVQTRLFKPFSSTKGSGMGVGSYESAQYIRELGGSIKVASQPGEGTLITILLPLFDAHSRSDLMQAQAR